MHLQDLAIFEQSTFYKSEMQSQGCRRIEPIPVNISSKDHPYIDLIQTNVQK